MFSNYYIVGPSIELCSIPGSPSDQGDFRFGFELSITQNHTHRGTVKAKYHPNKIELSIEIDQPQNSPLKMEIYRLFSRIVIGLRAPALPLVIKESESEIKNALMKDGFIDNNDFIYRTPGPFLVPDSDKVENTHDVYQDFFNVPWNQATRDWSVLFKVAEDLGIRLGEVQATRPGMRILDLGCGTGKNTAVLETLGFEVYGLDLSTLAIARCQQLVPHPERFLSGSAASLPWENAFFDIVLDIGCLHCMPEALRPVAVQEIARVMKPQGVTYSRSFKPREEAWIMAMPFRVNTFGMQTKDAIALFTPYFNAETWMEDPRFNFVRARPKGRAESSPSS